MSMSTRLKGLLDQNKIPYSVMTHSTAYTAQGAAATMQISGKELAKIVVFWAGEEMILAVLPAPNHVNLNKLGTQLGKRVRLATEQEFSSRFLDCELGAMPPFGSIYDLPVTPMNRWPPMRPLCSTQALTAMQSACATRTLFVCQSPKSLHSPKRRSQQFGDKHRPPATIINSA